MRYLFKLRNRYELHCVSEIRAIFPSSSYSDIAINIKKAMQSGLNDPLKFNGSACIFFDKGAILVKFCGIPDHLLPKGGKFADFHYQNSTDKPKKVTAKEWQARQETWERIFKHGESFGENGLNFDFCAPYFHYRIAQKACEGRNHDRPPVR